MTSMKRRVRPLAALAMVALIGVGCSNAPGEAGVAIMNVTPEKASAILDGDPCVQARMMRCEVHSCHGFPGDALPAGCGPMTIQRIDHKIAVRTDARRVTAASS